MQPPADAFFYLLLIKFEQATNCHKIQTELLLRSCCGSLPALLSIFNTNAHRVFVYLNCNLQN